MAELEGRELSPGIFGGSDRADPRLDDGAVNGPSRRRAGDAGRLPGIVSSAVPREGADCITASRACASTLEVSHVSKASWETTLMERGSE